MLRNYLAAALRNLVRSRLHAAINIVGLAVGFAAALLIALFVRDELSYDAWIPGHDAIYLVTMTEMQEGHSSLGPGLGADNSFAAQLTLDYPAVQMTARIWEGNLALRHGDHESRERLRWADPDFFRLVSVPVVAGNLATALDQPDGIVLNRKLARKYFGRDNPIGETIELDRTHPMRVTAVIEDMPSNTQFVLEAVASGRAPFSPMAAYDAQPHDAGNINVQGRTYLRLQPGARVESLTADLPGFIKRHKTQPLALGLVPIADVHLLPRERDPRTAISAFSAIGVLIIALSIINFVNLMTARAAQRGVEIGVRKVSGAERRHLIVQFIGEAALFVVLSMVVALMLAEISMPALNAALDRTMASPFAQPPTFYAGLLSAAGVIALLAGFYPALVLSAFRPAAVLRSAKIDTVGAARLRQALIVLQFAILIGLSLVAGITYRQTIFALRDTLRVNTDQIVTVGRYSPGGKTAVCRSAFKEAVASLPGVAGVQCSSGDSIYVNWHSGAVARRNGETFSLGISTMDYGFFSFFGVNPIAGRDFAPEHNDMEPARNPETAQLPAILNETAARRFGFLSAEDAVGQILDVNAGSITGTKAVRAEIIGVVPDFKISVYEEPAPIAYFVTPSQFDTLSVRLKGEQIPETLDAIDQIWKRVGDPEPIMRGFLDEDVQGLYDDIIQQARLFTVFAVLAMFIAMLGMFGLSSFIAERRTKEIGVRKSLGASRADILGLLMWEFCKPVLIANLLAWPVAYVLLRRWLEGFVRHITLQPWIFLAASALALFIVLLTVVGHALVVSRARPVTALRYE